MLDLQDLEKLLGYHFKNHSLVERALTHPSAVRRQGQSHRTYERLEFLGDRVLGLIVADMLLLHFPHESEGDIAKRHALLVSREACCWAAEEIQLGHYIKLSRSEFEMGGQNNPSILANCVEAIIGAIYMDGGLTPARHFVEKYWDPLLQQDLSPPRDPKSSLQEWVQAHYQTLPQYEVIDRTGSDHQPTFVVELRVPNHSPVKGTGRSKRAAEQAAAIAFLSTIDHQR